MLKLVDKIDLKSIGLGREGSIPSPDTKIDEDWGASPRYMNPEKPSWFAVLKRCG